MLIEECSVYRRIILRNSHFGLGSSKNKFSKYRLSRNSTEKLTSSTSVHTPFEPLPVETRRSMLDVKNRLKRPGGVDRILAHYSQIKARQNANKDKSHITDATRPQSVKEKRKKFIGVNKKLKALYGSLKKSALSTHFVNSTKRRLSASGILKGNPKMKSKSRQTINKMFQSYTPKALFENDKFEENYFATVNSIKQEHVSLILS